MDEGPRSISAAFMTRQHLALVIGGLLPAVLFGISGITQKLSGSAGLGSGPMLTIVGAATMIVGLVFCAVQQEWHWTTNGSAYAFLLGLSWATGTGLVALALKKFQVPLSQLVPLYNMNTLVAVALGLVIFSEWRSVQPIKILVASALIISGGVLAARS